MTSIKSNLLLPTILFMAALLVMGCGSSKEDPTIATSGTTDEGTTTEGTTDEGTTDGPGAAGLNGSPCEEAAQCDDAQGYLCVFGFCSKICRDDAGENIEGACDEFSAASEFGAKWGCPGDLRICMPGPVSISWQYMY